MHAVEGMACSQWIYHPADRNKTQWPYQNHHILPSICRTIRNLPPPTDSQPTGQTSTQSKPFRLSSHPQFKTSPTASNDNENTIDVIEVQPQHHDASAKGKRVIYNAQTPTSEYMHSIATERTNYELLISSSTETIRLANELSKHATNLRNNTALCRAPKQAQYTASSMPTTNTFAIHTASS